MSFEEENMMLSGDSHQAKILVGICSARKYKERRQAIRETWVSAADEDPQIQCRFFVGRGPEELDDEDAVVEIGVSDSYADLPRKVLEFFRHALQHHDFDWLFKCDDDTYLVPGRLKELICETYDLVGNEFVQSRGAPSGGAGYLLSRRLVEVLAGDGSIPDQGDEDVLIGGAALRHGFPAKGTSRLLWNASRHPQPGNDLVSCHWCSPERMRAIHAMFTVEKAEEIEVRHDCWRDTLRFSPEGFFSRKHTGCLGRWENAGKHRILRWMDWGVEVLIPLRAEGEGVVLHLCREIPVEEIVLNLYGGLGNQMFQYAHGLALSRRFRVPLKLLFACEKRKFALDMFGLELDADSGDPVEWIVEETDFDPSTDWPTSAVICRSRSKRFGVKGYFQNEGFFAPVVEEVRNLFWPGSMSFPGEKGRKKVCVHVRRGDFVGHPRHDVCQVSYYRDAMIRMREMLGHPLFLILSDEPEWCLAHLEHGEDVRVMGKMQEKESFIFMCNCDAFILSNSTFGWWPAWLSQSPWVIAPNRFLNGSRWNICPDRWIQMDPEGERRSDGFVSSPDLSSFFGAESCRLESPSPVDAEGLRHLYPGGE